MIEIIRKTRNYQNMGNNQVKMKKFGSMAGLPRHTSYNGLKKHSWVQNNISNTDSKILIIP